MTYAVNTKEMRRLESAAIHECKIPAIVLMENAALQTVKHLRRFIADGGKAVVACGPGNNGGDGYAIARLLYANSVNVTVIFVSEPATGEARINFEIVKAMGIPLLRYGWSGGSGDGEPEPHGSADSKADEPEQRGNADLEANEPEQRGNADSKAGEPEQCGNAESKANEPEQRGSADSEFNYRNNEGDASEQDGNVLSIIGKPSCIRMISEACIVVDALFGTGLTRPLTGAYAELVEFINDNAKHIVSVDVPSGLDADTGLPAGGHSNADAAAPRVNKQSNDAAVASRVTEQPYAVAVINANFTITYGHMKTGLLFYPGAAHAGEVIVEGISLPPVTDEPFVRILDDGDIPKLMPPRLPDSNKGSHGRVCVFAGSAAMPGAAVLSCAAAYRAGAGLVDACAVTEVTDVIHIRLPEAVTTPWVKTVMPQQTESVASTTQNIASAALPWRAAVSISLAKADVILLGPGLGQDESVLELVRTVLEEACQPIVLDADGLNAVAVIGVDFLRELHAPCVITPHPGEMSRLTGISVDEIKKYPLRIAREFSDKYGVAVLLKGARTVIASPCGATYINTSGCAALAKAGSGDVLAGVIAGIAAQKAAAQKAESQIAASSAYSLTVTAFAEAAAQNAITQIAATQKVTSQNATSQNSASSANILTITALAETTALAAFIHGRAGEHAAKELSVYGVNAGDVIDALKHPLRRICLRYR